MGITDDLSKYISENMLSVMQISADTGINKDKLSYGTEQILTAEELLVLCRYLNVRPEDFRKS